MPVKPKTKLLLGRSRASKPEQAMKERKRSADEYHTWKWTRLSRAYRAAHPLCAECLKKGLFVPAQVVDHIIPAAICDDFWDENNWQSLCRPCNLAKGNRDKALIKRGRKR